MLLPAKVLPDSRFRDSFRESQRHPAMAPTCPSSVCHEHPCGQTGLSTPAAGLSYCRGRTVRCHSLYSMTFVRARGSHTTSPCLLQHSRRLHLNLKAAARVLRPLSWARELTLHAGQLWVGAWAGVPSQGHNHRSALDADCCLAASVRVEVATPGTRALSLGNSWFC